MATLWLDTAGATAIQARLRIRYLPTAQARALLETLNARMQRPRPQAEPPLGSHICWMSTPITAPIYRNIALDIRRSEERRVCKECATTCGSRGTPYT